MTLLPPSAKPILSMEIVQMSIGEITTRLCDLVGEESYFEFAPFDDCVFTSREHDLKAIRIGSQVTIDVAEPDCGQPNLDIVPRRDNAKTRQAIVSIWDATRWRKTLISNVMMAVFKLNSDHLEPKNKMKMADIAQICDLHVTTVSRVLDDKILHIASGPVRCRDFIFGLRST